MRQFYTAALQFKLNRRFRESRLLDGVDVLANETQIVVQMALIASTLRFTPMCSCARCTLLFPLIVTSANFDVVKIMTNCRPIDQTHVFATWTCRH